MIRAQYHFRSSENGLLAWDVRRLIALAAGLTVCEVDLSGVAEIDEDRWYAHGSVRPTCRSIVEHCSLISAANLSYPVILDQAGRVMDGMHRVCKALMLERTKISVVQFFSDPAPDYVNRSPDSLPYDA